jgi:hypothetical protein
MVRHRQLYGIEIAATDQLTKILVGPAVAVAVLLIDYLLGAVKMTLVYVADGYHLHFRLAQETAHVPGPL